MFISTTTKYAIGLMLDLAEYGTEKPVRLKDVSERQKCSLKYLERIAADLKREGLLSSYKGIDGGYKMKWPVEEYTVGMILRAVEGQNMHIQSTLPVSLKAPSYRDQVAEMLGQKILKAVNETVDDIRLQDLIESKNNPKSLENVEVTLNIL